MPNRLRARRVARLFVVVALLGFGHASLSRAQQRTDGLFLAAPVASDQERPADQTVVRSSRVRIDFSRLSAPAAGLDAGMRLVLNLFDDTVYTAVLDRVDRTALGTVWVGHIPDVEMSTVTLATEDGVMYGSILMPAATYLVRPTGNGVHTIAQIDQSLFPPEANPIPVAPPPAGAAHDVATDPGLIGNDDGSFIDVMVLYTPAAASAAGGSAAISTLINNAISTTNTTYSNSGIVQRLRLAFAGQVAYTETGGSTGIATDLNNITAGVGALSGVASLRNTHRADVVTLLTNTAGSAYCGIAWFMANVSTAFAANAYNVVEQSCAVGNLSFPHELGHNMGAGHDWYVDNGVLPYTYSHGYVNPTSGNRWRTVMAYNDLCAVQNFNCSRVAYWSNPGITLGGAAMGVTGGTNSGAGCYANLSRPACDADDHRTLNNTGFTVANFRQGNVSVTSLTANVAFPVTAGTPVTWSAAATGGTAPYTYQFWVFNGSAWTLGRDWSSSNTWTWNPAMPGTYTIQVWARNAGSANTYDAWLGSGVTIAGQSPLTVTSILPSATSVAAGSPVTWTVTVAGGAGPHTYRFLVWDGVDWTVGREWGTSNTWTWTPPAAGTFSFQVWARNAGSGAAYDAWRAFGPMTAGVPNMLTVTGLTANRVFPVAVGTPVTWTASAIGGTGPYTYKYYIFDGSSWSLGQDWSASNVWTWIPSTTGSYTFQVWVRNAGSGTAYDAWRGAGPYSTSPATVLSVTELAADRTFPISAGTPVKWTATAVGGTGPYTFKFYVWNGSSWTVGQDWSPAHTWTWAPPAAGSYSIQVWARNAGSGATYDAWRGAGPAVIGGSAPLSVTSVTARPSAPLVVGGPAVIATTATGGTGPYTYKFWVWNGSSWSMGQDWSAASTWTWTPPAGGSYTMQVWVRNAGSVTAWDAWGSVGPLTVIPSVGVDSAAALTVRPVNGMTATQTFPTLNWQTYAAACSKHGYGATHSVRGDRTWLPSVSAALERGG